MLDGPVMSGAGLTAVGGTDASQGRLNHPPGRGQELTGSRCTYPDTSRPGGLFRGSRPPPITRPGNWWMAR